MQVYDQPTKTFLQLFCMDTGCSLEDLPEVMDDRDKWQENQGNLCQQCDMMMMVMIHIYARGVMVIVIGNGHGDMSSNPGQD